MSGQPWWRFYKTAAGGDVVRKELDALPIAARAKIVDTMRRHERGELLPREDEHIRGDVRALRVSFDGNVYRLRYAREGNRDRVLLALHVIQKKSQKLPLIALELAQRRLGDWRGRGCG